MEHQGIALHAVKDDQFLHASGISHSDHHSLGIGHINRFGS